MEIVVLTICVTQVGGRGVGRGGGGGGGWGRKLWGSLGSLN